MSLYICSKCSNIENTTLGNYISYLMKKVEKPICSECLTGKWHNFFPKEKGNLQIISNKGLENFVYLGKFEDKIQNS